MEHWSNKKPIVVIGAGFTGLAAAYEISRQGIPVVVLEKNSQLGGLASSFEIDGKHIGKFYQHWFSSDRHIMELIKELSCGEQLVSGKTKTGIYLNNKFYKLSTPLDVLRFGPLGISDRIRLGMLVFKARRIKDWKQLESLTAEQWIVNLCGEAVYRAVWEPLLRGKFGPYASEISAAWFWSKLKLRGGSRRRWGNEELFYYRGGFASLVQAIADKIRSAGGAIKTGTSAEAIIVRNGQVEAVQTSGGSVDAQAVIATPALPVIADLLEPHTGGGYAGELRKIRYVNNLCLVLELHSRLSDFYWLNIGDPEFPFVGIIEHTNFQPVESCGGRHIVYLSKYLEETDQMYRMTPLQMIDFAVPHIEKIFPKFERSWIHHYHVWKAPYAQPIIGCNYSRIMPSNRTPVRGFYIATMAQVYPEDRGTNYAVREGRRIAKMTLGDGG
jgi:protoporphyrinogen oxidase